MIKNFGKPFSRREFWKTTGAGMGSVLVGSQLLLGKGLAEGSSRIIEDYGGPTPPLDEVVLFPFDDHGVPLRYRLQLGLVSATNPHKTNTQTVLEKGKSGAPDSYSLAFYGSVIRVGDELRMWYIGSAAVDEWRVCYAISKDGIAWEKPALGLVEFNGNKQNNLVDFDQKYLGACVVMHEPEDPDPNRRFKMVYEISPYQINAAFSPDGLRWKNSPHNPILKHNQIEPGGLTKFNGCYYLNGQGGNIGGKRSMVTYISYDFDRWSDAVAVGLRRDQAPHRQAEGLHAGEQVHLGAALWNRGNVLLGVYGQWHGETNDRRLSTMDLGMVVSSDAMHFHEPIPDFQIVSAYEVFAPPDQNPPATIPGPALEAGQAFENVGDQTFFWYAPWWGGFICAATWVRDRIGYFEVVPPLTPKGEKYATENPASPRWKAFQSIMPEPAAPHFISCPLHVDGPDMRVFINAAGLSDESHISVELLDEQLNPLPGYSGSDCIRVTESGLRQPVIWRNKKALEKFSKPFRVKASWGGKTPAEAYVYAVYLSTKENG